MSKKPFALMMVCLLVAGCGGGGDEDDEDEGPDDASAAGFFTGTVTLTGGSTVAGNVLVTEDSRFMLLTGPMWVIGTGTTSGVALNASGTGYHLPWGTSTFGNGAAIATVSFNGTALERSRLYGSFSGGSSSGSFDFPTYQTAVYERAASTAIAAGVYQLIDAASTPTNLVTNSNAVVIIGSGGVLQLNDVGGCVGNGTLAAPTPSRNYYTWTMTLSACSAAIRNGSYNGLAFLGADPAGVYRVLNLGGGSGTQPLLFQGAR